MAFDNVSITTRDKTKVKVRAIIKEYHTYDGKSVLYFMVGNKLARMADDRNVRILRSHPCHLIKAMQKNTKNYTFVYEDEVPTYNGEKLGVTPCFTVRKWLHDAILGE
jgi:cupin superfamily acireductone dioxygenase involved in methionine salvage